jgi:hypothetical protein
MRRHRDLEIAMGSRHLSPKEIERPAAGDIPRHVEAGEQAGVEV